MRELADLPPILSVKQTAQFLGVSPKTIYSAISRGELPAKTIGSRHAIRVTRQHLEEYLGLNGTGGSQEGQ